MLHWSRLLPILAMLGAGVACDSGRHSASGFRLPTDGDVERGKQAFMALGCNSCHEVSGVELPGPSVQPPVPVTLGGEVSQARTDGYLTTSIIYPSYQLASYPRDQITIGGESRMPHYADKMTVRQLTDIVAFLQSRYTIRALPPVYAYH
jgi:mono/diheme cytochrome c family protein